ncbi:glycosyl transferase family 90 [Roseimaritima ulvae]|uniref:Glycosyl transferase CAP10 domain-containing protein n=1 Tax=Roseimaritima ulvae TaxID=980254 RepID=A0A5B9QZ24_9BACT|nr:glycosyl transferase family 90 [Roseimaritima ulvae]QEG43209.1 hypothetical protein UC8_52550 [Roseimaritima ulvae]
MNSEPTLPRLVVLPHDSIFEVAFNAGYWKYVRGTVTALADQIELQYSDQLGKQGWSGFEILVDGQSVVIDYSDFLLVNPLSAAFEHWLRFHHTPAFCPYPNLGSFPPWSFWDWQDYQTALQGPRYTASGESIIYRHSSLENQLPNAVERRTRALQILEQHCGDRLRTGFIEQAEYFQDCLHSLAVVHIPGSHPHILDRSVQQMFAHGVCVISPDLWSTCLEQRPQAGVHYVGILDDYSDLPEKVQWVAEHREQATAIGAAAQQFFADHCTPQAIWSYIHRRLQKK